jgi:cytochrome c biogenesis protein CcdA
VKILPKVFYTVGFILEVVIPLLLFGFVSPLIHGKINEGLTTVGLIVISIFGFICVGKFKTKVKTWDKSLKRALILALIKAIPLIVLSLFVGKLSHFMMSLTTYLYRIIPIFTLGCLFDLTAEYLESKE